MADLHPHRTAISVLIDDTHLSPEGQFAALADFCIAEGVRGKVSLIPALDADRGGAVTGQAGTAAEAAFLAGLSRLQDHGFDLHMELMTHSRLWDFAGHRLRDEGPCEGIWLYDPEVPVAAYEGYFRGILDTALRAGVVVNGVSVPGCDCARCVAKWADLQARGHDWVSPNACEALLRLAGAGRMGVDAIMVYADEADADHPTRLVARKGDLSVFDLRVDMSVQDQIGFDGRHNADFYISADGRSGRIVDLVRQGAAQCFFCAHWFSMNPAQPLGWAVFQDIIHRINLHLSDRIEWVRPSRYGKRLAAQGPCGVDWP